MARAVSHLRRRSGRDARRRQPAAAEIPAAKLVSLAGHSHISAFYEADDLLLPHILEPVRSAPEE
jgi:hypothetical protein